MKVSAARLLSSYIEINCLLGYVSTENGYISRAKRITDLDHPAAYER